MGQVRMMSEKMMITIKNIGNKVTIMNARRAVRSWLVRDAEEGRVCRPSFSVVDSVVRVWFEPLI